MYPEDNECRCLICNQQYSQELLKTLGDCCSRKCFVRKQEIVTEIRIKIEEIREASKV